jgi:hypothetical protein
MEIGRLLGRAGAMVLGIIGAILAFIITLVNFGIKASTEGLGSAHTPTGLAMGVLALVGAFIALPFPMTSAVAMLVAGIVMIFVAGGLGVIPLVFLAAAALLAFLDRRKAS